MKPLRLVGGFKDVYAWESDLDARLRKAGFKVKLDRNVSVLHRRKMTVTRSVAYQLQAGRARKELHVSPLRTLLHSVVRLRPFVMVGYLNG
jgi:GT2 family glycosyltransferase